ncbi:MAG TPA: hypothetical protein VKP30_06560, partial [Polyangiaceae bacterium]|nr:hypothetical protein [Polyangiaceae bacterium]
RYVAKITPKSVAGCSRLLERVSGKLAPTRTCQRQARAYSNVSAASSRLLERVSGKLANRAWS